MKKFMAVLTLAGMLSSCTYNAYQVKQDDQPKAEVQQVAPEENYSSIKEQRDKLIQICTKEQDSPCFFTQQNGVDHFILIFPNEKEMLSSKEVAINVAAVFCSSSTKLSIPSQFHVALDYERIAHDFKCSTETWGEWYSTVKQKNNRN
jgi:hypothetical protein